MYIPRSLCGVLCLALAGAQLYAAEPVTSTWVPQGCCGAPAAPAPAATAAPTTPTTPQTPGSQIGPEQAQQPPNTDPFSQAPPAGSEATASAAPQMLGDSLSYTGGNVQRGGGTTTTTTTTTTGGTTNQMNTVLNLNNSAAVTAGALQGVSIPLLTYKVTVDSQGFLTASVINAGGQTIISNRSATPFGSTSIPASALPGFTPNVPPGSSVVTSVGSHTATAGNQTTTVVVPGFGNVPLAASSFTVPTAAANTSVHSTTQGLPLRSLGGSSFKTSDNESPRPQDRIFEATSYFTRVLHSVRDADFGSPNPSVRLAREIFGFEKTFLDGNASVELRAPFFQTHQTDGTTFSDFGDITVLGKFAFVNEHDDDSDAVLTLGTALTIPTGPDDVIAGTTINPFIIQPFIGYLFGNRSFFVQGFSEMAISLSDSVPTVWFNDIGFDAYAYRGTGAISAIVPTLEGHLTTALGKQGSTGFPVGVIDSVVLTAGVHLVFARHAQVTFGYEFPVTGPQPFESEYVLQFNYRF